MVSELIKKIKRKLGIQEIYTSETSKVRHMVVDYCNGYGCDIGFGGDKIKKIDCIGIDYAKPYAHTGKDKVDVACDVMNEPIPLPDNTFDYVYSSHLIEDFKDTRAALIEFIRIMKSDGNLVLVFPDQKLYEEYCEKTGQPVNTYHIHKEMGYDYMVTTLNNIKDISYEIQFCSNCEIDYNVVIVAKVKKH